MDNRWAGFVVLLLGDPHLLEGRERGKDGSSDPDGVLPLGRSDNLDLHGGGSKGGDLLLHAVSDSWGINRVSIVLILVLKRNRESKL